MAILYSQVGDPEDGCQKMKSPEIIGPWIALIVRSQNIFNNCTFDAKVRTGPPQHKVITNAMF